MKKLLMVLLGLIACSWVIFLAPLPGEILVLSLGLAVVFMVLWVVLLVGTLKRRLGWLPFSLVTLFMLSTPVLMVVVLLAHDDLREGFASELEAGSARLFMRTLSDRPPPEQLAMLESGHCLHDDLQALRAMGRRDEWGAYVEALLAPIEKEPEKPLHQKLLGAILLSERGPDSTCTVTLWTPFETAHAIIDSLDDWQVAELLVESVDYEELRPHRATVSGDERYASLFMDKLSRGGNGRRNPSNSVAPFVRLLAKETGIDEAKLAGRVAFAQGERTFDLSDLGLTRLPEGMPRFAEIDLEGNHLCTLSEGEEQRLEAIAPGFQLQQDCTDYWASYLRTSLAEYGVELSRGSYEMDALGRVVSLDVSNAAGLGGLGFIEKLDRLKVLKANDAGLTDAALMGLNLEGLEGLERLEVRGNALTFWRHRLPPSLRVLDLSDNEISYFAPPAGGIPDGASLILNGNRLCREVAGDALMLAVPEVGAELRGQECDSFPLSRLNEYIMADEPFHDLKSYDEEAVPLADEYHSHHLPSLPREPDLDRPMYVERHAPMDVCADEPGRYYYHADRVTFSGAGTVRVVYFGDFRDVGGGFRAGMSWGQVDSLLAPPFLVREEVRSPRLSIRVYEVGMEHEVGMRAYMSFLDGGLDVLIVDYHRGC